MVSQLAIGEQQKVEILKMLLAEARVLILDEPPGCWLRHEVEALFRCWTTCARRICHSADPRTR